MYNKTVYFILITIFISFLGCVDCYNKPYKEKNENGETIEGTIFKDSLFNGEFKCYDNNNNLLWRSNYTYGIRNGVAVSYYKNGMISDSLFYYNGKENGFAYQFDSANGKILYKAFYVDGRTVGHTYNYDSTGDINEYYFNDFDQNVIFDCWKKSDGSFNKVGSFITAKIYQRMENGIEKNVLLLYLLTPPILKSHYEIAIMNKRKEIISSQAINSSNCYYEQTLDGLPDSVQYAIVFHIYNPYKKKDDLIIRPIEIDNLSNLPVTDTIGNVSFFPARSPE